MTGLIVHEWIEANGGAEKVVEAMVTALPDSRLLALWDDAPGSLGEVAVRETWIARTPLRRHKVAALPWLPATWRYAVPRDVRFDWLLVSSHLFAHHVRPRGRSEAAPKLVYAHTPARYLWTPELDARGASLPVRLAAGILKPLDRHRAAEITAIAANSDFVRERIAATWEQEAIVIHPPVEVSALAAVSDWSVHCTPAERAVLDALPDTFVLGASRLVPYKRLDRVIEAAALAGLPAVIAGGGPMEPVLREQATSAPVPVSVLGRVSDALLRAVLQRAAVFVFPPVEDFGIVPVEAMALRTPVVCHHRGGASESLRYAEIGGEPIGAAVDMDDDAALAAAVSAAASGPRVPPAAMAPFSRERFERDIAAFVARHTGGG